MAFFLQKQHTRFSECRSTARYICTVVEEFISTTYEKCNVATTNSMINDQLFITWEIESLGICEHVKLIKIHTKDDLYGMIYI